MHIGLYTLYIYIQYHFKDYTSVMTITYIKTTVCISYLEISYLDDVLAFIVFLLLEKIL